MYDFERKMKGERRMEEEDDVDNEKGRGRESVDIAIQFFL